MSPTCANPNPTTTTTCFPVGPPVRSRGQGCLGGLSVRLALLRSSGITGCCYVQSCGSDSQAFLGSLSGSKRCEGVCGVTTYPIGVEQREDAARTRLSQLWRLNTLPRDLSKENPISVPGLESFPESASFANLPRHGVTTAVPGPRCY